MDLGHCPGPFLSQEVPMAFSIEYNGYTLTPETKLRAKPKGWTLEVHITPADRRTGKRRCRAKNTYATEKDAVAHCLEFGRRIVDGKIHPRPKEGGSN